MTQNNNESVDTKKTYIDSVNIKNFRSFENVSVSIGRNLTMISGINGVGKSTILGILAQICSFNKTYIPDNEHGFKEIPIENLKTVYGKTFSSNFKNHFRISEKYDKPENEYIVDFKINDAQEKLFFNSTLKKTHRGKQLRLVLRKDKTISKNLSRNITFPTIYLGLNRLTPIASRTLKLKNDLFSEHERNLFEIYSNKIFISSYKNKHLSSNNDKIGSSVLTDEKYDITSASSGEDNLGQIISSLISFVRLENNYEYYVGGLLLIDEIDASLFPKAQTELLKVLNKFSTKYNVQIVFTTHSPIIISEMLKLHQKSQKNSKTKQNYGINFINRVNGRITNQTNMTFDNIVDALNFSSNSGKIRCYCEDDEAHFMIKSLLDVKQYNKISILPNVKLGANQLISLYNSNVPEFRMNSIIIVDGDQDKNRIKNMNNTLQLPSTLPPDQLCFYLMSSEDPANSNYWNSIDTDILTYEQFINDNAAQNILALLYFDDSKKCYSFKDPSASNPNKIREMFKKWFNDQKELLENESINPIKKLWIPKNTEALQNFKQNFETAYQEVYSHNTFLS